MDAVTSPPRLVRFEAFEFDRHTLELRKHGLKIKLSGQPMEVLALLLARPGELVAREEFAAPAVAARHDCRVRAQHQRGVKTLRRALDDSRMNLATSRRWPGAATGSSPRWRSSRHPGGCPRHRTG